MLLLTRVHDGDAVPHEGVDECVFGEVDVGGPASDAGDVVAFCEDAEDADVFAGGLHVVDYGDETVCPGGVGEKGDDGVVGGEVEDAVEVVLVVAYVGWVGGDDLPHAEDPCCFSEGAPEVFVDVLDGVDAETVD